MAKKNPVKTTSPVYAAAIDLGATSGRVILGTWAKKKLILREVHRFPNAFQSIGGHDYWNIAGLWTEIQTGLAKATQTLPRGARLASVGVDTWGVDYVLLNDAGRLVYPAHAYRDNRTQAGLKRLANTRAALARIYEATGIANVFYNSSLQLEETICSCPAITDLATRCLLLPDYFNYLLSGRAANELTIASTTQLLDVHSCDWSRAALDYFRVPASWLTKPVLAGTKLGKVRATHSPALEPLAGQGTQVIVVPGHDTACAYDAMPAAPGGGDIFLSSGTWSLVGFESDTPVLGAEAMKNRICNERIGDGRYRPLTNVIGMWLLERTMLDLGPSARPKTPEAWDKLIADAARLPVSKVLIDVTDPALANPASMKAVIDGQLRKKKATPPKNIIGYMRLICDSLGQGHANAIRVFEKLTGRKFERILIVGGGSRSPLLCQTTADAAGIPVVSFSLEGTAVGNLANQLVALGAVKNIAEFRALSGKHLKQTVYNPRR